MKSIISCINLPISQSIKERKKKSLKICTVKQFYYKMIRYYTVILNDIKKYTDWAMLANLEPLTAITAREFVKEDEQ